MNKIALLIFFCVIFKISHCQSFSLFSADSIYDFVFNFLKGLSITENGQCIKVYSNNKEEIIQILNELLQGLEEGYDITNLIFPIGMEFFGISGLISKCQVLTLLDIYNRISTKDGIKEIGSTIYNNAETIYNLTNDLKKYNDLGDKLVVLGKILSIIFNFFVN